MKNSISIAISIQAISDCFPVIKELRTHLELPDFITQVQRQQQEFNYQLVYLRVDEKIQAVAGFRISESLAWGKFLYVDDLVSKSDDRSKGYGSQLFNWLIDYAQTENCQQLTLDSGVQRFATHRFYLRHRMNITSHHFTVEVAYQEWVKKRQAEGKIEGRTEGRTEGMIQSANIMVRSKFGVDILTPEIRNRLSQLNEQQLDEFTAKIFTWQDASEMTAWLDSFNG